MERQQTAMKQQTINVEMADVFKRKAPDQITALRARAIEGDMVEAATLAHDLSNSARLISAVSLCEKCQEIAKLARAGKSQDVVDALNGIDGLFMHAWAEANKTSLDKRVERIEDKTAQNTDALIKLEQTFSQGVAKLEAAFEKHVRKQEDILALQTRMNAEIIAEIKVNLSKLVDGVTGKDQVPIEIHNKLIEQNKDVTMRLERQYTKLTVAFGLVIALLLGVIWYAFTGQKRGWIPVPGVPGAVMPAPLMPDTHAG